MKKTRKKVKKETKENIYNIPNFITATRVIITFVILYLIFTGFPVVPVVVLFVIGMITDGLDGFIARRLKQTTKFGARFDMTADRILFIGTISGILIYNISNNIFGGFEIFMILLLMTREIVTFPFALISFFSGTHMPERAHFLGKSTTFLQAVAFPMFLLKWPIAIYFVVLTAVVGFLSSLIYIRDVAENKRR